MDQVWIGTRTKRINDDRFDVLLRIILVNGIIGVIFFGAWRVTVGEFSL
jgi:hypothetical protein